jgi:hypothetical protein
VTPTVVQARSWRAREDATPTERAMRAVMSVGFGLAFVVGGALLFAGARAGLFGSLQAMSRALSRSSTAPGC